MILKMRQGRLGHLQHFKIPPLPAVLGRASGSEIWIPHPQVSAAHARFERREDGRLFIVDLGSANGLRKDGHLVPEAPLVTGSHFEIGQLRFEVDLEEALDARTEVLPKEKEPLYWGLKAGEWMTNAGCLVTQALVIWGGSFIRSHDTQMWSFSIGRAALSLPVPFVLALTFALLSKLHVGEYHYWSFFRRCSLILTTGWLGWISADFVAFNAPAFVGAWFVEGALLLAWVLASGYSIGRLIFSEQPSRRVLRWMAGIDALLLAVLILVGVLEKDSAFGFTGTYSVPVIHWSRSTTQDALGALDRHLASTAKRREEALKEEDED